MNVDQLREALATMPGHLPVHVAVNSDQENGGGADTDSSSDSGSSSSSSSDSGISSGSD